MKFESAAIHAGEEVLAQPWNKYRQRAKAEYNERNQENALVMQAKLQQTAMAHAKFFESFLKSLLKPYAIAENFRST